MIKCTADIGVPKQVQLDAISGFFFFFDISGKWFLYLVLKFHSLETMTIHIIQNFFLLCKECGCNSVYNLNLP